MKKKKGTAPAIGYKGFDKDLKCRDMQYEVGKEFTHDGEVSLCAEGLHYCEHPLDVLKYYRPNNSRFAVVHPDGVSPKTDGDSKRVAKSLKIETEITLRSLIDFGVKFILKKKETVDKLVATTGDYAHAATTGNSAHAATTGDYAHAATTGNSAHAATTGNSAHAATTGYSAHAATTGNYAHAATTGNYAHAATTGNSAHAATTGYSAHAATTGNYAHAATTGYSAISAALGIRGQAKAALGSWLVLAEYDANYKVKDVQTAKVDGKKIKADAWYRLLNGKFTEVK